MQNKNLSGQRRDSCNSGLKRKQERLYNGPINEPEGEKNV